MLVLGIGAHRGHAVLHQQLRTTALWGAAGWGTPAVPREGERRLRAAWPRPRPPAPSPPSCSALSWGAEASGAIPSSCLSFPNSLRAAQHNMS